MRKVILILALLLVIPCVIAGKPEEQTSTVFQDTVFSVVVPKNKYLLYDAPYNFSVHLYNSSGLNVGSQSDCELGIYNSTGEYMIDVDMAYHADDSEFVYRIPSTTFEHKGSYPFIVHCNSTALGKGGYYTDYLDVLPYEPINDARSKMYVGQILLGMFLVTVLFTLGQVMKEQHAPFKMFLTWLGFIGILPVINFGLQLARLYAVADQIVDMMNTFYYLGWAVMLFASAYFGIYLLTWALSMLKDSVQNPFRRK